MTPLFPVSTRRRHVRHGRVLAVLAVVATMTACAAPDTGPEPASEPAPSTSGSPVASTPDPTTSPSPPSSPVPSPGRDDLTPSDGGALPSEVPPTLPTPPTDGASMGPELQEVVEAATNDLADRVGVEPGVIEVMVARAETFSDGALGCPKEGEAYTQALVEGYRVVLRRDDRVWLYTAPGDGQPRLCPSGDKDGGHGFVPPPGFDD